MSNSDKALFWGGAAVGFALSPVIIMVGWWSA